MKRFFTSFLLLFIIFFSSCSTIPEKLGYLKQDKVETQINDLKKSYEIKISQNQLDIENKYQDIINTFNKNAQDANSLIYGIITLESYNFNKNRNDQLIEFKSKAAFKLLPAPTAEQILAENENLKKELDEKNTTLSQLSEKYAQIEKENEIKKQNILKKEADLENLKREKEKIDKEFNDKREVLRIEQEEKNKLQLSISEQKLKDAQSNKELKAKLAIGFAGLGAIVLIVGIWVLKDVVIMGIGGGFIAFSLFVATAPDYVLYGVPGLLILAVGLKIFLKYNAEKDINDGNLRAIQRFFDAKKDGIEKPLDQLLIEEHGKYDSNGKLIEDPKKMKIIDKKLIDLNIKS